jgi:hypothetical protein
MFFRTLTRAFWVLYDNLFKSMLLNLMLFLSMFGLFALFFMKLKNEIYTGVSMLFLWHVVAPAYMHYYAKLSRTQDNAGMWRELGEGFKLFALRGLAVFALNTAVLFVIMTAVNFYRTIGEWKIPMLILGGVGIWVALVFMLMQIYLIPIMVMDEKRRVFTSYKKALLMVMSSPFATSTLGFLIGYFLLMLYPMMGFAFGAHIPTLLALTALFPIFLMPFLSFIFIMILQINATVITYEKHNIYPALKEYWEGRTLNNIFKPWETK